MAMTDLATVGYSVDTSGLKKGEAALDKFDAANQKVHRSTMGVGDAANSTGAAVAAAGGRARNASGQFVKLGADVEHVTGRFGKMRAMMQVVSGALGTATGAAIASGAAFVGATLGIGAMYSTLANFETQMSAVGAVSRASAEDLKLMRDMAKDLGSSTEFSASQAAEGFKFLSMAGFDAKESLAALPDVLNLATAAQMDLAQAADYTSNIMSGFGIAATDAARVADVLAAAASRANTSVPQLAQAMRTIAPVAAAVGISFEDTAAAIGVLSDAGLQGEMAGTSLRGVIASIAGPTEQAAKVLAKLGLSAADVNPELHDMDVIFKRLKDSNMSTADAMAIFGREAASGAFVLMEANERLGEFGDELRNAQGEGMRMAEMMRDNLGGSFNSMKSALEGVVIALGEAGLIAVMRGVLDAATMILASITQVINAFTFVSQSILSVLAPAFDFLSGIMDDAVGYIGGVAVALTVAYLPAMASLVAANVSAAASYVVSMIPAMVSFTATIYAQVAALVTLRGALIATGYGAIVVLAGQAINMFMRLSKEVGGFGNAFSLVQAAVSVEVDKMIARFEVFDLTVQAVALDMRSAFLDAMVNIVTNVADGASKVIGAFVGAYEVVKSTWSKLPAAWGDYVYQAANWVVEGIQSMVKRAAAVIDGMINGMAETKIGKLIGMDGSDLAAGVSITGIDNPFAGQAEAAGEEAAAAFQRGFQVDYVDVSGAVESLKGFSAEAASNAESTRGLARAWQVVADQPNHAAAAIKELTTATGETVDATTGVREQIEAITDASVDAGDAGAEAGSKGAKGAEKAAKGADKATKAVKAWTSALQDELMSVIDSSSKAFGDWVARGFKDFKGFVKSVLGSFQQMLSNMIAMAARNRIMISMGLDPLSGALGAAGVPGLGGAAGAAGGLGGGWLGTALGTFGSPAAGGLLGGLGGVWSGVSGGFASGGILGAIGGGFGSAVSGISGGLAAGGLAGITGAIGAAIPIIGAVAGVFALGKKLFGRKLKDTGVDVAFDMAEGVIGRTYKFYKGGWLSSDKTKYSGLSEDVTNPINEAMTAINETTQEYAKVLGGTVDNVRNMGWDFKFSTKGMDEDEIQARFQEEFDKYANALSTAAFTSAEQLEEKSVGVLGFNFKLPGGYKPGENPFGEYRHEGETNAETLERLATSLIAVNDRFGKLGLTLEEASLDGGRMASNIVDFFGGMESMMQATGYFYDKFYSDQEKLNNLQSSMSDKWEELHLKKFPKTMEEFRSQVEWLNANGWDKAAAQLMLMAPDFVELLRLQEEIANKTADNAVDQIDTIDRAAEAARENVLRERNNLLQQYYSLTGNTNALRQQEIRELDGSHHALQRWLWKLEDSQALLETATDQFRAAADAEREWIDRLRSRSDNLRTAAGRATEAAFGLTEAQRMNAQRQLEWATKTGKVWKGNLESLADTALAVDSNNFSNQIDYLKAAASAATAVNAMAQAQADRAKEREDKLNAALDRFGLKEDTVLSLTTAIQKLESAMNRVDFVEDRLEDESDFQKAGRLNLKMAEAMQDSTKIARETKDQIRNQTGEVVKMKEQLASLGADTVRNAKLTRQLLEKWDVDGSPAERG